MSSGYQKYDFNHVDDVVDGLLDTLNFKKRIKNFHKLGI